MLLRIINGYNINLMIHRDGVGALYFFRGMGIFFFPPFLRLKKKPKYSYEEQQKSPSQATVEKYRRKDASVIVIIFQQKFHLLPGLFLVWNGNFLELFV